MKISVIIVNYKVKYHVHLCLLSLKKALQYIDSEIIVVDNYSNDGSVEYLSKHFPEARIIAENENSGFAKANNLGVKNANGEYVLILNPDTIVPENTISELLDFADKQENLGAIGVQLVNGRGEYHPESKRNMPNIKNTFEKLFGSLFKKNKTTNSYYANQIQQNENAEIQILVGAFMLLKKETYLAIGGFDEAYFMYGEDIDLSATLLNQNLKNYYLGSLKTIHFKGESTKYDKVFLERFFGAMRIFTRKFYARKRPLTYLILRFGTFLRHNLAKVLILFDKTKKVEISINRDFEFIDDLNKISKISSNKFPVINLEKISFQDTTNYLIKEKQEVGLFHPEINKIFLSNGLVDYKFEKVTT